MSHLTAIANRQRVQRVHQPVESRVSGVRLEHHEPDGPRDARADEKPVDVR